MLGFVFWTVIEDVNVQGRPVYRKALFERKTLICRWQGYQRRLACVNIRVSRTCLQSQIALRKRDAAHSRYCSNDQRHPQRGLPCTHAEDQTCAQKSLTALQAEIVEACYARFEQRCCHVSNVTRCAASPSVLIPAITIIIASDALHTSLINLLLGSIVLGVIRRSNSRRE